MSEMVTSGGGTDLGRVSLESVDGLWPHNVVVEPAMLHGKIGVRLSQSERTAARVADLTLKERSWLNQFALVEGVAFSCGVIEAEVAGDLEPGADEEARGFVGIVFRLQPDMETYDAFHLRPTNGRAEDQERRNHSVQYVSHPEWPWYRLRREAPSRYETYVDLVPGEWVKIKIEVRGRRARLYVHDSDQPTLIVNDLKSGTDHTGAVALWIGAETIGHFRNLTVRPLPDEMV